MDNTHSQAGRKSFQIRLQHMVDRLRSDIMHGAYSPGELLPSEMKLAEQFHLSNKSVRKGLDMLVGEGLIVKVDRVGSRVTDNASRASVSLSFGYSASIERDFGLSSLLEDFHSLHPSIRVKEVPLRSTTDYMSTVKEYMENDLLDAFTLNNLDFQHIVDNSCADMLEPLTLDTQLYRFTQEAFVHDHRLLTKPVIFSPIVLAYNRSHFHQSNVPEPDGSWKWDDVVAHAAALTIPGKRHGLYFYLLSDNRWPALLLQSGMRFEPETDGSFRLNGTRLMESIRLSKELIDNRNIYPRYLSENSDDVNELFAQGKVSMILTTYMAINDFKDSNLNYDVSPLPYIYEPRSLLNVIGAAVSRNSKQKEAAMLLIDYLGSPRAQTIIREKTLSIPALKQAAETPLEPSLSMNGMNRPSRFFMFRETMSSYRMHRDLNLSMASFNALRSLLKQYWSDLIDEQTLCDQATDLLRLS
ncbi:extracellular solute-binding protein [Cohnella silvisoli]|uniref:Extracellular solute-binding protein n=1 Tax=Cohnella silvisoli TaxID=2873699 RepID=A0ABV1L2J7_9BACL|nr:extracellular solute-binding protein [Cohnella silvisoli]MCD9021571.1 extracellular solute-binding protein [Cohnella silvisoli]